MAQSARRPSTAPRQPGVGSVSSEQRGGASPKEPTNTEEETKAVGREPRRERLSSTSARRQLVNVKYDTLMTTIYDDAVMDNLTSNYYQKCTQMKSMFFLARKF